MPHPGPSELGRGVVVLGGGEPPGPWKATQRVVIDQAELEAPGPAVEELHQAWLDRRPVVVELNVDPAALRVAQRHDGPVYRLSPSFEFTLERLQFLVWANNYDARSGEPVWWHGRKAARRFADQGVAEGGEADLVLADGTPLFVDGGPADPPPIKDATAVVHRWSAEAGRLDPVGHRPPTAELAEDQLAAVAHRAGAARVIAPAGSGKTRVLTERLRHLIEDRQVHPGTVTALAFNTRAAEEMKQRCADILTPQGPHIRTLNSIGLWICNEFGPTGGRLKVLEEGDVRDLLQRLIEIRRQSNTDTVAPYLDALSAIRLGLTSPRTVEEDIPDATGIAEAFDRYRAALSEAGAVDFDEQVYRAIEILLTDPVARAAAQARSRRLLVDEFQDLTPAHLLLIRLLAAPDFDCFGVGDDDQVIYGYSGATPEFLIDFPRYFPGAGHHALEVNYRCPPAVVDAARHLLSYNRRRLEKTIRTPEGLPDTAAISDTANHTANHPTPTPSPVIVVTAPSDDLPRLTVDLINRWRADGTPLDDIAVLARVNSALLPVQVACMEAGIPSTTPLGTQVLRRTGMRTAFAYLRIGTDPGTIQREDVIETIRRPSRGIAPMVADMLTRGRTTSVSDIRRLARRLTGKDVPKLNAYADALDTVAKACECSTAEALRTIRIGIGLDDTMSILDSSRREADRSTHADDLVALESVAAFHADPATFEPWLRDVLSRPAAPGSAVLLSTVHRIKGKEWGHVVVFGANRGLFPHRLGDDEEGERRVFHVALTRARTTVALMVDENAPSMFMAELDGTRPRVTRQAPMAIGTSPTGRSPAAGRLKRGKADRPRPSSPRVGAAEGLAVEHGGHSGTVEQVTASSAMIRIGTVRVEVTFGTEVKVDGRVVLLVAPGEGDPPPTPESAAAEAALRGWRTSVAKHEKVPPYVVLNDKELTGIATRLPATLAELAGCRGMGQIRLERWGDEILAALESSTTAPPSEP